MDELRLVLEFYRELGNEKIYIERIPEEAPVSKKNQRLTLEEKKLALAALRDDVIGDCVRCRLSEKRTTIVFGEGDPDCDIMFIGEGPGEDEDLQGRPFVGKAGQVLRSMIRKMGLKESEVFIANVVKCRPPGNRVPSAEEIETCIPFLREQIDIIRPKVIVLLGNVALQGLLGDPKLRITSARGKFTEYEGIKVMPTFHPSYLLRNPKDKWLTWDDAVAVLRAIGKDAKA